MQPHPNPTEAMASFLASSEPSDFWRILKALWDGEHRAGTDVVTELCMGPKRGKHSQRLYALLRRMRELGVLEYSFPGSSERRVGDTLYRIAPLGRVLYGVTEEARGSLRLVA